MEQRGWYPGLRSLTSDQRILQRLRGTHPVLPVSVTLPLSKMVIVIELIK